MNTKIETVVLMASRTWNLLNAKIISERVLFDQLDYDILATYFILEDVLATRQCNDKIIYSSFTKLARRAQSHYKRRPNKEISIPLVQVDFEDLPYDDASLENYVARALSREAAWRLSESI